jgi:hypothetical protein
MPHLKLVDEPVSGQEIEAHVLQHLLVGNSAQSENIERPIVDPLIGFDQIPE